MKYTQQDKARILRITSRTLLRWKSTKPELYALIEAGFILREGIGAEEEAMEKAKDILRKALPFE